jgi:predicted DNA-binding protein (UPF0251 family)
MRPLSVDASILSTVTEHQRAALRLWAQEDLTFEELGERLGVSSHAAEELVRRARRSLRRPRVFWAEFGDFYTEVAAIASS